MRETRRVAGLKARGCVLSPPTRERGEIDLIMRDGAVTVFVEVRYRAAQVTAVPPPASRRKNNKITTGRPFVALPT
jgi:Holliday junction resolvase-like predicted endonuclease